MARQGAPENMTPPQTQGERYWSLVKDLVDIIYATHPNERLGLCEPILQEEFPYLTKRTIESTSNTILRFVVWMCENDTYAANDFTKTPIEDDD